MAAMSPQVYDTKSKSETQMTDSVNVNFEELARVFFYDLGYSALKIGIVLQIEVKARIEDEAAR